MSAESFRLIVRQGIEPGKLEEFKRLAQEFTAGAEAAEPETLGYEWFVNEEGTACYLNEFYADSAAFLRHFKSIGPKIQAMLDISPLEEAVVLGEPNAEAKEMLSHLGAKFFAPHVGFTRS